MKLQGFAVCGRVMSYFERRDTKNRQATADYKDAEMISDKQKFEIQDKYITLQKNPPI